MRLLPTGTVTFLFTDIEGSSRLWENNPETMRPALARHDRLLRRIIEDNGGYVFKTIGDAFCATFARAPDALAAALAAQQSLFGEAWQTDAPLRVRMALHSGSAEERDGDYFGPSLNCVARLMAAGHGGQTLLSGAAQEMIHDCLPSDVIFRDLGLRRLKDLGRPEQVYQVIHPSLPADFPPLNTLDNPDLPNNLPQQATRLIGRETQIAEIKDLLGKTRLLTLTGTGGCGKTRLSLQVAADLLDRYFDGVWVVELAALTDPALLPQTVAEALDVREEPGKTMQRTLTDTLKAKRLLLVLDNCEHLIAACASLAADLLRNCPHVQVLASSREPLNVAGEQTYRVPSLSLPDPKQIHTAESVSQYGAVQLFIERAQAVQSTFAVTSANALAVAQVCWRLDGIPLAIELAAARVRALPVEEINTRLDNRFRLLTGGARGLLPRQQTLRALIDWSYDLLTDQEKSLLRRLSVFAGGWSLAAAEGICTGEDSEVLDLLTSLVDKSLIVHGEGASEGGRSRLLETIQQYAGERLRESGEAEATQDRAAAWFLALAEEAEPELSGPEQAAWLSRLEMEHDNLRAGLSCYEQSREQSAEGLEAGLRLAGALSRFWYVRGHYSEGRQWLGRALARTKPETANRIKALNGAGVLARCQGDYAGARALHEESLKISRQRADQSGMASSLNSLGVVAWSQGDYAEARALHEESLAIQRQLGDKSGMASSLSTLGVVAWSQGDYIGARALHEESLAIYRQLGNRRGIANLLSNLGIVAKDQGDYAGARALHEESLAIFRQLENQGGIASSLNNLGDMAKDQGDYTEAQALFAESLTIYRELGEPGGIAWSLGNLGDVAKDQGDYTEAQALFAESLTIYQQLADQEGIAYNSDGMAAIALGQHQPARAARLSGSASSLRESLRRPLSPADQERLNAAMASARDALGGEAFAANWDAGRAMTLEQTVEYALGERAGPAHADT